MALTKQEEARIKSIEKQVRTVVSTLEVLDNELKTKINQSTLLNTEKEIDSKRKDNSEAIRKIEEKLSTIILPEDTRYYLESSEVEEFRANFNKLQALLAEVKRLYKDIVAYTTSTR